MALPIVRLLDAYLKRQDGVLFGELKFQSGDCTVYSAQPLPTTAAPNPVGWAGIQLLTDVSPEDVIASWCDYGEYHENPAATLAFARLADHFGQRFFARWYRAGDHNVADMAPLRIRPMGAPAGLALTGPTTIDLTDTGPGCTITDVSDVVLDPADAAAPWLIIETDNGATARVLVPDDKHHVDETAYGDDWWQVEVISRISGALLARSWKRDGATRTITNPYALRLVATLRSVLIGQRATLLPNGHIDLDSLRRSIVRAQFARGVLPLLYTEWPSLLPQRAWCLLRDTVGEILFRHRADSDAGDRGVPAMISQIDGKLVLEQFDDADRFRALLSATVQVARVTPQGRDIPRELKDHTINQLRLFPDSRLRAIEGVTRIPVARHDGTVLDGAGYDGQARLWYAPEVAVGTIPEAPTAVEVTSALETLLSPFQDFPFVDESGIAGTLACLLDQLVRPMIQGPRPIFVFDAPSIGQGTGKTLIATAIGAVVTGKRVGLEPWPSESQELAKTITTILHRAKPFVVFDNVEGVVNHKELALLATTSTWEKRLLHTNEAPPLPQNTTWCLTVNGARFNADIARRVVLVRLDSQLSDATRRKAAYAVEDLAAYMITHRASLIRSALILVRAWVAAGSPRDPDLAMPSFETWARVTGGILRHAGIHGLPQAVRVSRDRNVEGQEITTFLRAWAAAAGLAAAAQAKDLVALAEEHGLFAGLFERARSPTYKARLLSDLLRPYEGREVEGLLVGRHPTLQSGRTAWRVQALTRSGPGGPDRV